MCILIVFMILSSSFSTVAFAEVIPDFEIKCPRQVVSDDSKEKDYQIIKSENDEIADVYNASLPLTSMVSQRKPGLYGGPKSSAKRNFIVYSDCSNQKTIAVYDTENKDFHYFDNTQSYEEKFGLIKYFIASGKTKVISFKEKTDRLLSLIKNERSWTEYLYSSYNHDFGMYGNFLDTFKQGVGRCSVDEEKRASDVSKNRKDFFTRMNFKIDGIVIAHADLKSSKIHSRGGLADRLLGDFVHSTKLSDLTKESEDDFNSFINSIKIYLQLGRCFLRAGKSKVDVVEWSDTTKDIPVSTDKIEISNTPREGKPLKKTDAPPNDSARSKVKGM